MKSDLIIRPVDESDMAGIVAIYGWSVENETASFELEAPSFEIMHSRMLDIRKNGFPYLVAEYDDTVVGFAYASAYRPRSAYRFTVENTVYVHRDAQGQGAGKALLLRLIVECEKSGFRQMMGVIGGNNRGPSIALHASCDFTEVGHTKSVGWKRGGWHDVVTMQRALGAGDNEPPENG